MRVIEIPPKPSPLIESIRAIGYSLSTALADLVDNCIAAQAKTIQIFANTEIANASVGILDDGVGLTEEELLEAMRLGSRSPLEERAKSDLGRFGLGLKTASFSQCRVLTVVSRTNGTTMCARWDLDHIAESGRWQVQILDELTTIPGRNTSVRVGHSWSGSNSVSRRTAETPRGMRPTLYGSWMRPGPTWSWYSIDSSPVNPDAAGSALR